MWLTDTGGFFYYSPQFHRPLGCAVARLEIRTPEETVLDRYVIELVEGNELRVKPTMLAMATAESRDFWVKSLRSVQDKERTRGEDKISPLEPFTGHGLHTERKRLSTVDLGGRPLSNNSDKSSAASVAVPAQRDAYPLCPSTSTSRSTSSESCLGVVVHRTESFGDRLMSHCSTLRSTSKVCAQASTGLSVFASPKSVRGGGSPKMRTQIRRNSQADFTRKMHTVLVLDWDDTLFPTTFVRKDCRLDWRFPIAEQVAPGPARVQVETLLDNLSKRVEAFLNLACSLAQVVIVTLAANPWVTTSSQNFMPRVGRVIQQQHVEVIYARERISQGLRQDHATQAFHSSDEEANYWMRAKAVAMQEVISNIHGENDASWKNIISIGDSDFERVALGTVAAEHFKSTAKSGQILETGRTSMAITKDGHLHRLRAKTVKMLDEPSCEELIAQATLFQTWLPHLINKDAGLDIDLMGSQDDSYLTEVHQYVTGQSETMRWRELASVL